MRKVSDNGLFYGARGHSVLTCSKRWTHLRLGLLLMFFMVILTVIILNAGTVSPGPHESDFRSQQFRFRRGWKYRHRNVDDWPATTYLSTSRPISNSKGMKLPGTLVGEVFSCDRSHFRTDVCFMRGDVRMDGKSGSFILYTADENTPIGEERVKPYTRKWETSCMNIVHEVKLKAVSAVESAENGSVLGCEVHHSVPAVMFTTGGYTGNLYHEFHDGLIPLFITSQHLSGEVVFVIDEFHNWWLMKYGDVVRQMSNYDVIQFDNDSRIHCFPEVTVGLHIHDELSINPALMPHNESIRDFRVLLDHAYTDLYPHPDEEIPFSGKPRLVIIVRKGTRVILNLEEIVALAESIGLEVKLCEPDPNAELKKLYWTLNSSDILMGVHGAAMTHFLFMRPGTVFIQIVPLGTSWAAATYYGEPAVKLGLQYIEYKIIPEESSLSYKYDKHDPVLINPEEIIKKGWWILKEIYLEGQDVKLSLPRLEKVLLDAKTKAVHFFKQERMKEQRRAGSNKDTKPKTFLSQERLKHQA